MLKKMFLLLTIILTLGMIAPAHAAKPSQDPDPEASFPVTNDWSELGAISPNEHVYAITTSGDNVYIGGRFTNMAGLANADYLAKWNGTKWSALGAVPFPTDVIATPTVYALAISGNDLYIGGSFTDAGGVAGADYIAKWNTQTGTWSALGTGLNNRVNAIFIDGTDVYVGGQFLDAGGNVKADRIAKWDGTNWSAVGNGLGGAVYALGVSGTDLYAGGAFQNAGGNPNADHLAKWNGTSWSAVGTGTFYGNVMCILVKGTDVYVGGGFIQEGNNIAKWDGTTWSALGQGLGGTAYALVTDGTNIFAGGYFSSAGGIPEADSIAKWDGTQWSALNSKEKLPNSTIIAALAINDAGVIYQGGNGGASYHFTLAQYGPTQTFSALQGHFDGFVLESTETSEVGGTFDNTADVLSIGDSATKQQYRGILSFRTSYLPDNAIITGVTLKVKRNSVSGDPINTLQGLMADVKNGIFGTIGGVELVDFQDASPSTNGPFKPTPYLAVYSLNLNAAKAQINKLATIGGLTQFRLRFKLDDNNDAAADLLNLFSGDTPNSADRPKLVITYRMP